MTPLISASSAALEAAPARTPLLTTISRRSMPIVHWSAIVVGVFSTLATAILMAVLGVAIGLSALDAHNLAPVLSIGASVWGIVTVGVSFFLGGWMAGRTTGITDTFSQLLHGVLVWIVTVPLTVYLLAAGVGDLLVATASDVVTLSPQNGPNEPLTAAITPEDIEHTAAQVGHSAWNILSTLLFGFAAAGFGGFIGNRQERIYETKNGS